MATYDPEDYNSLQILKSGAISNAEMRKAYQYFRKIANKNLEVMGRSEYKETAFYLRYKDRFDTLKVVELGGINELAYALRTVANFLTLEQHTVTKMRKLEQQRIETMKQHGLNLGSVAEYRKFWAFMEDIRNEYGQRGIVYDPDKALSIYKLMSRRGANLQEVAEDYEFWENNIDKARKLRRPKDVQPGEWTSSQMREAIEKKKWGAGLS